MLKQQVAKAYPDFICTTSSFHVDIGLKLQQSLSVSASEQFSCTLLQAVLHAASAVRDAARSCCTRIIFTWCVQQSGCKCRIIVAHLHEVCLHTKTVSCVRDTAHGLVECCMTVNQDKSDAVLHTLMITALSESILSC